jgi:hypothetical protein
LSAFSTPVIVGPDGAARVLARIPLGTNTGGGFLERWLQDALFAHPQCLPVKEIDPHIGELIPICTEIETGAGPADILFVTRSGQLVLVETKLWRNPQARREVVAQILDYAKQLTSWKFEDLARQAAATTRMGPEYLIERVKQAAPDLDEAAFVDGINRSLKQGDFLLLIAGDGIRSGAEALVGFIEQYGNLRFGLGLIEVAAYQIGPTEVMLQPRILAKTEVLERTVILASGGLVELEQVAAVDDAAEPSVDGAAWYQSFWADFSRALRLDDVRQPLPMKLPRSTNYYLYMPPGRNLAWISTYIAQSTGEAGVYLTFAKAFEKTLDFYELLRAEREDIERGMGVELFWEAGGANNKVWISVPKVSFTNLDDPIQRQRVIGHLADYTNRMVNAFRHRLEALSSESGI